MTHSLISFRQHSLVSSHISVFFQTFLMKFSRKRNKGAFCWCTQVNKVHAQKAAVLSLIFVVVCPASLEFAQNFPEIFRNFSFTWNIIWKNNVVTSIVNASKSGVSAGLFHRACSYYLYCGSTAVLLLRKYCGIVVSLFKILLFMARLGECRRCRSLPCPDQWMMDGFAVIVMFVLFVIFTGIILPGIPQDYGTISRIYLHILSRILLGFCCCFLSG